jgi:hypothetical protein
MKQTYWQHMRCALSYSWALGMATVICFLHAVLPFLFKFSTSRRLAVLQEKMRADRERAL